MSAGRGVMHSEYNASRTVPVHFLQIWIEPSVRGIAPGYEQLRFEAADKRGRLRLKTVTETDVYLFAGITGDFNPAHVNEAYAKNTFFKGRIAHGMLSAGFISAVLAMKLPGPGTIYLSLFMEFKAPVRIGDTVTARVEVKEKVTEKNRVKLRTTCVNQDGTLLVDGEALIMPPKAPKK